MSSSLNRFDRYSFYYLVGLSPIIILATILVVIKEYALISGMRLVELSGSGIGWTILGIAFGIWMLDIFYLVTKMVLSKSVREIVMTKLAGMKERDERESIVAGNAAKFSFLSSLAMLIFLFVFSTTTLTINRHPKDLDNKRGKIFFGFNLNAIDETAVVHEVKGESENFNYKSLPITKPVMILFLIFWQVGSYHLIARRELKD